MPPREVGEVLSVCEGWLGSGGRIRWPDQGVDHHGGGADLFPSPLPQGARAGSPSYPWSLSKASRRSSTSPAPQHTPAALVVCPRCPCALLLLCLPGCCSPAPTPMPPTGNTAPPPSARGPTLPATTPGPKPETRNREDRDSPPWLICLPRRSFQKSIPGGEGRHPKDDQYFFQRCPIGSDLMEPAYPLHTRLRTDEDMPDPNRAAAAINSQLSLNQAIACFRPSSKGVLGW